MFKKDKPFKDAETNPEPPQRDFRDFLDLFFSFLWFHHKSIAGLILVIGLGYWISFVITTPDQIDNNENASVNTSPDDVPVADINFSTTGEENSEILDGTSADPNSNISAADPSADSIVNSPPTLNPRVEPTSNVVEPELKPTVSNKLLESGTVDELIEQSLKLGDNWGKSRPGVGMLMNSERAKIARRLLELELTESQRKYALVSYIESISFVDSLNVAGKMKLRGTRDALLEIDKKYSTHEDPTICAKANLAMTVAPIYDFLQSGSKQDLMVYQTQLANRINKIARDRMSLARLADLAVNVQRKSTPQLDTKPVSHQLLREIESFEYSYAKPLANGLKERIIFDEFDPATLADRAQNDDKMTRQQIQAYFQALADNPDSSEGAYQVAVNIIVTYQTIGKTGDASLLAKWLDGIAESISNKANRDSVKQAIARLIQN